MRNLLRLVTFAIIIIAVVTWLATLYGWLVTEPGFEPLITLISAILSSLIAFFGWLGTKSSDKVQPKIPPPTSSVSSTTSFGGDAGANNIIITGGQNVTINSDRGSKAQDNQSNQTTNELPSYQSSAQGIADVQKLRHDVEVLEARISLGEKLALLGAVYCAWVEEGKRVFELKHEVAEKWGFDSWKRANVAKYLVGHGFLLDETPDYVSNISYTQVSLTQEGLDWYREHSPDHKTAS